tara:strand:+ start:2147 stop:2791 length:645 start_codon:yes stop_codon:yes gene_type:complete
MKNYNKISNKKRMINIVKILKSEYPNSKCSLNYQSPFQLLVATILSAQCTDKRVNQVTKKLFNNYSKPEHFKKLTVNEIGQAIYSTGFYNNKAKSIKGMVNILLADYNGKVPNDINKLIKLPGVGRKTANVVLGNYFNIPSLVVDTHVTRISNLLKFVKTRNAVVIESKLSKIVEKNDWTLFAHLMIDHGRLICVANRPKCDKCAINKYCPSAN